MKKILLTLALGITGLSYGQSIELEMQAKLKSCDSILFLNKNTKISKNQLLNNTGSVYDICNSILEDALLLPYDNGRKYLHLVLNKLTIADNILYRYLNNAK